MHRCHGLKARHLNPTSCRAHLSWECCCPLNLPHPFCHGMRTQILCHGANLKKSRLRHLRRLTILDPVSCTSGLSFSGLGVGSWQPYFWLHSCDRFCHLLLQFQFGLTADGGVLACGFISLYTEF